MAAHCPSRPLLFFSLLFVLLSLTVSQSTTNSSINCDDYLNATASNGTIRLSDIFQQCLNEREPYEACPDPSLCDDGPSDSKNLALAFGLTIGAGLSTTVGALLPFIPCIRRTDTRFLAIALALACGVMLFVSFTEILGKSRDYLCCITPAHYDVTSYSCFFVGIILTVLLDLLVLGLERIDCGWPSCLNRTSLTCCNRISRSNNRHNGQLSDENHELPENGGEEERENVGLSQINNNTNINLSSHHHDNNIPPPTSDHAHLGGVFVPSNNNSPTLQHSNNNNTNIMVDLSLPDNDLILQQTEGRSISGGSNTISTTTNNLGDASIQDLLSNTSIHRLQHTVAISGAGESVSIMEAASISLNNENYDGFSLNPSLRTQSLPNNGDVHSRVSGPSLQRRVSYEEMLEQQEGSDGMDQFKEVTSHLADVHRLRRMGLLTGLAIALHNFPEGLATFVATLSDPSFGGALAIAIALHNIPEGICVSMPVYYATGSRLKAFLWAFLSGISEPLGALLGWAILQRIFGPLVYGIAFGIIAGMMVYVSLKELLPTAHKFDKTNGILVSIFLVIGMAIMALSLVLLAY